MERFSTEHPPASDPIDFRLVLNTAHEAFVAIDERGRVTEWNLAAEKTFGWSREEALGRLIADLIIPEAFHDSHHAGIQKFLHTGDGPVLDKRLELPAVHRDGHEFPVEITISAPRAGDSWFFHAFLHDISERKRHEAYEATQLAVSRALAQAGSPEEGVDGVLRTLCEAFGWQYGGFWRVRPDMDVLHGYRAWHAPDQYTQFETASRAFQFYRGRGLPGRVWETGEAMWRLGGFDDDGFPRSHLARKCDLHAACAIPMMSDGRVAGVMEFFAERMDEPDEELLQMLETTGAQLGQFVERKSAEQAAMELKENFVATVSHELRTPLTSIGGFAETMLSLDEQITPDQRREFLRIIADQTTRLTRLVEDLLTMSRLQSAALKPRLTTLDMAQLVAEVLRELDEADIPVRLPDDAPLCACADRDLVKQTVVNYLVNARRYGEPPVAINLTREGEEVVLRVCDSGPGVPPAFVPMLFAKFSRAEETADTVSGTGLGLAIVRSIAELQDGRVWYESNVPHGARFCLALPAV